MTRSTPLSTDLISSTQRYISLDSLPPFTPHFGRIFESSYLPHYTPCYTLRHSLHHLRPYTTNHLTPHTAPYQLLYICKYRLLYLRLFQRPRKESRASSGSRHVGCFHLEDGCRLIE